MKNNEQYIRTEIVRPDFGEWGINLATRNKNWGSEQIFFSDFSKITRRNTNENADFTTAFNKMFVQITHYRTRKSCYKQKRVLKICHLCF
jgi:hypothetical protein